MSGSDQVANSASGLRDAWDGSRAIEPLRLRHPGQRLEDAYEIQRIWSEERIAGGETILGRKVGLTSRAVQEQMGVDEPDFGILWGSRFFPAIGGRVEVPADTFIQPRIEGELAFLLKEPPPTQGEIQVHHVLASTEAVAPSIEIIDSRIEAWDIELFDTVADNASYGGFTLGPWSRSLLTEDLRTVGMMLSRNGVESSTGIGAAALGHPAAAVAWLLNTLRTFGVEARAGDIVLSGALGPTVAASVGDLFTLQIHGQPPLTIALG